jgi:hypothetical protein
MAYSLEFSNEARTAIVGKDEGYEGTARFCCGLKGLCNVENVWGIECGCS